MPPQITSDQRLQLENILEERYFKSIPKQNKNCSEEEHRKNRLSRALAAFAIEKMTEIESVQAVNAVVNGHNDNGIDAIHFDRVQNKLFLVQSKAGKAPDMGENKKFCDGIDDLINKRFDKFKEKHFSRMQPIVEDALDTSDLEIVGCHIYLSDALGSHAIQDLNQLKNNLNKDFHRFDWRELTPQSVYEWLTQEQEYQIPTIKLELQKWQSVEQPMRAFYGLIPVRQLAEIYARHGNRLFEKNIRYYLGEEIVNLAIEDTISNSPEKLFYLNNGITAVCSRITPVAGASNDLGKFNLEGFSIVNGAQTVGSIASIYTRIGNVSGDAKILITLIEIGSQSDDSCAKITQARNTQNVVRSLYFAALDPVQECLRRQLAVSGVTYLYRPSDVATSKKTISIDEAIIALACFSGETDIVITAKRDAGRLYPLYKDKLFPEQLSGLTLKKYVDVFRMLDSKLESAMKGEKEKSKRRAFYRHSRFFVLHILARRNKKTLNEVSLKISKDDEDNLSRSVLDLTEFIWEISERKFAGSNKGYLSIFRNRTDAVPLAQDVMRELAERDRKAQDSASLKTIVAAQRQSENQTPIV